MAFSGDLKDMSLADLLQSIQQNKHTGTLLLHGSGKERDAVFCEAGAIAAVAPSEAEQACAFTDVLVRRRAVTAAELEKVQKKRGRKHLKTALAEAGLLDEGALRGVAEAHVRDLCGDLFLKPRGRFEFKEGPPEKDLFDADLLGAKAAVEAQGVILEGGRRIDEWGRLGRRIGGMDEVFISALDGDAGSESGRVSEEAAQLLTLLDGRRDVRACVAHVAGGRFRTLELLGELIEAKRARLATPEELSDAAEALSKAGDAAGAIALLRRAVERARNALGMRERIADLLERAGRREEAAQERKLLGAAQAEAGELGLAIAEYERAARLVPSDPSPLERALEAARKQKDAAASARLAMALAERLTGLGLPERARSIYVQLLAESPGETAVAEKLGQVLERMGDRREAAAVYRRLGREREKRRDAEGALAAYRRATSVDPDDKDSRRLIIDLETGRAAARAAMLRRAARTAAVTAALVLGAIGLARETLARRALEEADRATLLHRGAEDDRPAWIEEYRGVAGDWPWTFAGSHARFLADGLLAGEHQRADEWEEAGRREKAASLRRRLDAIEASAAPAIAPDAGAPPAQAAPATPAQAAPATRSAAPPPAR